MSFINAEFANAQALLTELSGQPSSATPMDQQETKVPSDMLLVELRTTQQGVVEAKVVVPAQL